MVKKEGSTLVTVLGVTVVFMTLAVTILTSIMGTMKANNSQKVREDLKYAAESGLEVARSYLNGKNTITQGDIDTINEMLKKTLVDVNNDGLPDTEVGKVELVSPTIDASGNIVDMPKAASVDGKSGKFTVRVKAEKKDETDIREYAGANYQKTEGNSKNIFDYGLVAEKNVDISNTGSTSIQQSIVGSGNSITINGQEQTDKGKFETGLAFNDISYNNGVSSVDEIIMRKVEAGSGYSINGFRFYKKSDGSEVKAKEFIINMNTAWNAYTNKFVAGELTINGTNLKAKEYLEAYISSEDEKTPIVIMHMVGMNNINGADGMSIVLINSNNLEIELKTDTLNINRHAIINRGRIDVNGKVESGVSGTVSLKQSTIFGEEIKIDTTTSVHITNQIGVAADKAGLAVEDEIKAFNEIIGTFIPKWDKDSGIGATDGIKLNGEFEN